MRIILWVALICALGCGREASVATRAASAVDSAGQGPAATAAGSASQGAKGRSPGAALPSERVVIREAMLRLRSGKPLEATDRAAQLAREAGGFVLDAQVRAVSGAVHESTMVLRVPTRAFEPTLSALHALGEMREESMTGQDVTEELVDTEARVRALHTLEVRLLALLDRSGALDDLLRVEQELARVRSEIERYEGRVRYLTERAAMATIRFAVEAPDQPQSDSSESIASRLGNALGRSVDVGVNVVESGIIVLGFVVPASAASAMVAWPWMWLRGRRRLRAQRTAKDA
jgi:hypothetical protein